MFPLVEKLIGLINPLTPIFTNVLPVLAGVLPAVALSLKQYWKFYLIGLFGLFFAGSAYEWRHTAAELKTEKAAHQADNKAYHDAQAEAEAKAVAKQKQLTKQAKDNAHAADKSYNALAAKYRANLLRYQASQGARGGPNSGQPGNPAQGANGPRNSPDLSSGSVTISVQDAQVCADNTARLSAAHDWAVQLKDKPNENP